MEKIEKILEPLGCRRTVRRYADKEVSDELIERLIKVAAYAPTTGGMQLYSFVVTRSEEGKRALAPLHFNQPQVKDCAVLVTVCADLERTALWAEAAGGDPRTWDNAQGAVVGIIDAVIAAQQLCTSAEMIGLGVCYLGTTTYMAREIGESLGLPERVVPVVTLSIGWPADGEPAGERAARLPIEAIFHRERYTMRSAEETRVLFADIEARDDSRRFVAESGVDTLAQVATQVRYRREDNLEFGQRFASYVGSQGMPLCSCREAKQSEDASAENIGG